MLPPEQVHVETIQFPQTQVAVKFFVCLLLCSAGMMATTYVATTGSISLSIFLGIVTWYLLILLRYVYQDARATFLWKLQLGDSFIVFDLPSNRSITYRTVKRAETLAVQKILAIRTRLEAYRSFGMANMHRNFIVFTTDGQWFFLGEDRAVGTKLQQTFMHHCVDRLSKKYGVTIEDLRMVEGKGGFLSILFTSPPALQAENLSLSRQQTLLRKTKLTGNLAVTGPLIVLIGVLLSLLL